MMRIVLLAMLISVAALAVPGEINYQGKLTDTSGVAFEGVYTITFSIYNVETGGSALWTEAQDVTLVHGLFDVRLGSVAPIPSALDFSEPYWLEISIGGETLSPRQPLTSSPYAFRAAIADSVVGGSVLSGNNLDEAYDASPSGNKRIDADDGAVEIVSGLFNGPLSVTSNSIADAAIYATNAPGGNAIWADENIYANDANIIAKGDVRVEDASGYTAGLVGDSGNFWLHGRIEMNNDRTIFARNSSDALKGIFTPLNGADDVILSMADGNNFYIQDNTYDNVAQFAGGDVALYLFGDLSMDTPTGSGDFDILMNDNSIFNATIVEANTLRDNDDGELAVDDDLRVGNALYIGDVPVDAVAESVLTIDGGQVKKVAASSIGGADADWAWSSGSGLTGDIYHTGDVGIGTTSPVSNLEVREQTYGTPGIITISGSSGSYDDVYGQLVFRNPHPGGTSASIKTITGGSTEGYGHSHLAFFTSIPGGSPTEKMRIKSNGDVGIGTTSPAYTLDVAGNGRFYNLYLTPGYNKRLTFTDAQIYTLNPGNLYVPVTNNIYLQPGNNVGIGTTSPAGKLDIVGGALAVGGNPGTSGQVLTSQGSGMVPVWQTPAGGGFTSRARGYCSSAHTFSGWSTIHLNAETYDELGEFNTATYRFTASTAGYYLVIGQIYYSNLMCGEEIGTMILKNGSVVAQSMKSAYDSGDYFYTVERVSDIIYLAAGNYLELQGYRENSGSYMANEAYTFMTVHKLSQ